MGRAAAFVGRAIELATIDDGVAAARDGRPRLVLLVGDPGVGKTSLVRAASARAHAAGAVVGVGSCVDVGRGLPFAPVRGALRVLGDERFADLVTHAIQRCPQLSLLLPGAPGGGGEPVLGEHGAALLFEGMLDLIDELTTETPLVLVLEDVHWADRSTLELLAFVTRNLSDQRLLLLATMRPAEPTADVLLQQLVGELQRLDTVTRVDVGGLSRADLRALARSIIGREPDALMMDALLARTEGNPFFAVELLSWSDERTLPPTIRDALHATLQGLDAETGRVVRAAAAIGRDVHADLLAAVVDRPALEVTDALRDAVEAGVFVPRDDDLLEFRHALMQEAAYATLVPLERRGLHLAIAEQLEDHPDWAPGWGHDAVLAYHLDRAGRAEAAFAASLRAADAAVATYGYSEAYTHLSRALELWALVRDAEKVACSDEIAMRMRAADCATWAGRIDEARETAESALTLLDAAVEPLRWAEVAERVAELRWQAGAMPDAIALLDAAAAVVDAHPDAIEWARITRIRSMYRLLATGSKDGLDDARRAVELARRLGDRWVEAAALDALGCIENARGNPEEGGRLLDEAFELARRTENSGIVARAGLNRMYSNLIASHLDAAERAAREGIAAVRELGIEQVAAAEYLSALPRVQWLRGDWADAEDTLRSIVRPAWSRSASYVDLSNAMYALGIGELDTADRLLEDARRDLTGNLFHAARWAMTVMQVRLTQGRAAEALEFGRAYIDQAARTPGAWFFAIGVYMLEAMAASGAPPAEAEALFERLRARFERIADRGAPAEMPAWMALAGAWHAELRGDRDPLPEWEAASSRFAEVGYLVDVAWIDLHRIRLLIERGEREAAAALVASGHEFATRIGARPLRERYEDVARRARLSVASIAPAPTSEQLGLTDREAEVLRLIAVGRTNKEIGEELFISTRTASVHVSNIIRKLGVTNRGEAAALAHRHGLVS